MAPLTRGAAPALPMAVRAPRRPTAVTAGKGDIGEALNIGPTVASALRDIGIANVSELRTLGAMAAWERLRQVRPGIATARTLLQLEGAARGMRIGQLPERERDRLRLFATHARPHA
jgi:hypothetical protein